MSCRELGEVADAVEVGVLVLVAEDPADMAPEDPLERRVHVELGVGGAVVLAVVRRPPQWPLLCRRSAAERQRRYSDIGITKIFHDAFHWYKILFYARRDFCARHEIFCDRWNNAATDRGQLFSWQNQLAKYCRFEATQS